MSLLYSIAARFFYNIEPFDNITKYVKDFSRFDLSKLDSVPEDFDNLLHEYQNIAHITDNRINKICTLLYSRINRLKSLQKNSD